MSIVVPPVLVPSSEYLAALKRIVDESHRAMATLIGVDFGLHDATVFGRVHPDGRYEVLSPEEFYAKPNSIEVDSKPKIAPIRYSRSFKLVDDLPTPSPKAFRKCKPSQKHKRRATNRAARKARRRNRA